MHALPVEVEEVHNLTAQQAIHHVAKCPAKNEAVADGFEARQRLLQLSDEPDRDEQS